MKVGGCLHGENNHLIPETEHNSRNAGLNDVESLCGEHFDHVGTYDVKAWSSFRGMESMEAYLERKADTLCTECLELSVRFHGWPETTEVKRELIGA